MDKQRTPINPLILPMPPTPPRVKLVRHDAGTPDANATIALLQAYSDDTGFHCPKCGQTITNPNYAIEHLAKEINASFDNLEKDWKSPKPKK